MGSYDYEVEFKLYLISFIRGATRRVAPLIFHNNRSALEADLMAVT